MTRREKPEKRNPYPISHLDRAVSVFDKFIALLKSLFSKGKSNWEILPKPHRIGISVLTSLLFLLVIMPASEQEEGLANDDEQEVFLPIHLNENETLESAYAQSDLSQDSMLDDVSEDGVYESIQPLTPAETIQHVVIGSEDEDETWVNHRVAQGDTLTGIFRAQKLPLRDLYAITAIEGKEKPLSQIKSGQRFRFKRNIEGFIEALQVETKDKKWIGFSRLPNGSFTRTQ